MAVLLDDDRLVSSVARYRVIGKANMWERVRQARVECEDGLGLVTSEGAELGRLRRENARPEVEPELLNRATALWVKPSGQRTGTGELLSGVLRGSRRPPQRADLWRVSNRPRRVVIVSRICTSGSSPGWV